MSSHPPPLPPNAAPPAPKKGLPAWAIVLLICAGVCAIPVIAGLVSTVAIVVPKVHSKQQQLGCMNNLSQLGQVYLMRAQENPQRAQRYGGASLWLQYRKDGSDVRRGEEKVLICPVDAELLLPQGDADRKRWDDVDLAKPDIGLTSYAGRDFERFPLQGDPREPIGACLHHRNGAVVVFASGEAQFVTLADLGLTDDDEKVVGPASKSPVLRVLR